jgi:hypothetical protein
MATLFLPLNGIGLGHISRSHVVAEYLLRNGERPIMMVQGYYPEFFASTVPGLSIPLIYKSTPIERIRIADEIARYSRLSMARAVVEDTHPSPIVLPASLTRILLVRPTAIEYMRHVREIYKCRYNSFVICDHPRSPTWPYSEAETSEMEAWDRWSFAGPIYRSATKQNVGSIRCKYGFHEGEAVYIFTMGGGGSQKDARAEISHFFAESIVIAHALKEKDSQCRLLFVRGPLFPMELSVPAEFEDVTQEPDMPTLLAVATGAVIRPGFNTTWECIGGRTPFFTVAGQTFMEPVEHRDQALRRHDLLPRDLTEWLHPSWRKHFSVVSSQAANEWLPDYALAHLHSKIVTPPLASSDRRQIAVNMPRRQYEGDLPFLLRIDDVIVLDDNLLDLLEFCVSRALCPSLEVIPYLARFDETLLQATVGSSIAYDISQHGFAHLPRRTSSGRRAEIVDSEPIGTSLMQGREILMQRFPIRFRGGFSAPYDYAPATFSNYWHALGGRYMSFCQHKCPSYSLPVIRPLLDPWDWSRNVPIEWAVLLTEARRSRAVHGHIGIAIHPFLFDHPGERHRTFEIIDRLLELGCVPRLIGDVALGRLEGHGSIESCC